MSETVDWPKASEGGRVIGKEAMRAYWTRQSGELDPMWNQFNDRDDGTTDVKVHQLVKTLNGDVLSNQEVSHTYIIVNGLIERMDVKEDQPGFKSVPDAGPSAK
jgi:hypothetical protein